MRFEAIYFDLFNTLVHFDYTCLSEIEHRGKRFRTTMVAVTERLRRDWGVKIEAAEVFDAFLASSREMQSRKAGGREFPSRMRFELLARQLGIQDPACVESMVATHMEGMFRMMSIDPHAIETLDSLGDLPKILGSNFDHAPTARKALQSFGIGRRLDAAFISDEVGWRKPSPRFFQTMIEGTGHDPARCLFVGDDPVADAAGAARAGFQVAWLRRGEDAALPTPEPRWTLESLAQVPALVGHPGCHPITPKRNLSE